MDRRSFFVFFSSSVHWQLLQSFRLFMLELYSVGSSERRGRVGYGIWSCREFFLFFCFFYPFFFFFFFFFFHIVATINRLIILPLASAYWVFSFIRNCHRTLTWTSGSLTGIRNHSYACVYTTREVGTPTASQHNIIICLGKNHNCFLVLLTGFEPRVIES